MKKTILVSIALCLASALPALSVKASAQEVYKMVLQNAEKVVGDPTSTYTNTQIAQFKITALRYLRRKAIERDGGVSTDLLDYQAYYMSEFLNMFFNELVAIKNKPVAEQKKRINLFIDASGSNPMFGDTDTEVVHAYVIEGNEITPFSLDTDWEKAIAAVLSQKNKK